MQDCSVSLANALQILQPCTTRSICVFIWFQLWAHKSVAKWTPWPVMYTLFQVTWERSRPLKEYHTFVTSPLTVLMWPGMIDRKWSPELSLTFQLRHNERHGISNHRHLDCSLNSLFRRTSQKTPKLRVTGLCEGNPPVTVDSHHNRSATRKMFPFYDVTMKIRVITFTTATSITIMIVNFFNLE